MDDDGTPFRFWRSQTAKHFGTKAEQEKILELHKNVLTMIESISDDVESEQDRFQDSFLQFCKKKLLKKKDKNESNVKNKIKMLWKAYKQRERLLKFFFSKPSKFSAITLALLPSIGGALWDLYFNNKLTMKLLGYGFLSIICILVIVLVMFVNAPNHYCTFEKLEFDKVYKD